jgi:hypothetical protein
MAGFRRVAVPAVVVAAAAAIVATRPSADAGNPIRSRAPSTTTSRSGVAADFVAPADKQQRLLTVPGVGRFGVRCRQDQRLRGTFTSTTDETMFVTVESDGGRVRGAALDPGKRMAFPPADGAATAQRWQFAKINEASSSVALVFVSSRPAYGGDPPVCAVSAYAIGPTEKPRTG